MTQGPGDFLDRFQAAAHVFGIPLREVALDCGHFGVFPKFKEHQPVVIGSRSAQVLKGHGFEGFELGTG